MIKRQNLKIVKNHETNASCNGDIISGKHPNIYLTLKMGVQNAITVVKCLLQKRYMKSISTELEKTLRKIKMFKKRETIKQVEEGNDLAPKFDKNGFIPVITTDVKTGVVLMHAYMNDEALKKTITTKEAHYYSRSRKCLWHKGATSGLIQDVKNIFIDDDQDCIWLNVSVRGEASCHVGYKSCFYREINLESKQLELKFIEDEKIFDPEDVYGDAPNPTIL
jgi:phosphoribosyl-AMP cyclohydrolase